MAFKIITIPFDKKICEFNNEILDKFVNNKKIEEYLLNMLNLSLKKEATYFNKVDNGISFCGVRIFKNLIRIKRESITISQTKIKQKLKEYQNKEITEEELYKTLNSIFGYWKNIILEI
ncbi:MAG: hypothetical protein Q4A58_03085 [Fusobacterium sp.]|uniref:hypothetical protein n=1 Tax=Fusobacterium sp. TaxID=68766 RepID=UPI0026DD605E|nr:hypothetical protein [Fusobacterium sp.]MDO4690262.1 hypothetical protein [Fusobacterium sp.]